MSDADECFFCGCFYTPEEALRVGVPPEYIGTYCSVICYERDTEQMKKDLIAEGTVTVIYNPDPESSPKIVETTIGGFNLKINTNAK